MPLTGDYVELFDNEPVGPFSFSADWTVDGGAFTSTGTSIKPPFVTQNRLTYTALPLTNSFISAEVLLETVTPADDIAPFLAMPDGSGYTISINSSTNTSAGPADLYDIQRIDAAGFLTGLLPSPLVVSPGTNGSIQLRLEYDRPTNTLTAWLNDTTLIGSIADATYDPTVGGIYARALNIGGSALQEVAFSGNDPADTSAPVFTTEIDSPTDDTGNAGTIAGHAVTDASLPITYSATLNGVPMPTAGWTVDTTTGEIGYPAGLAVGTYDYVLTATDAATPGNSATSSGTLTIEAPPPPPPPPPPAAADHAVYPAHFFPKTNFAYENVGSLGPSPLPGLPANEQVYYDNQNGDLVINPDGSYVYVGTAPLTFDVEVSNGDGTWDTVSVTVYPLLDLETPNQPDLSAIVGAALSFDLGDVYNDSLMDPNTVVLINSGNLTNAPFNFPAGSTMDDATGIITVDTSTAGVYEVTVSASQGSRVVVDTIEITVDADPGADFSYSWALSTETEVDVSFSWEVDGRSSADLSVSWQLDGRASVDSTYSWLLDARGQIESDYSWLIDSRTSVDSQSTWVIGQTPTDTDTTFAWRLDAREESNLTASWELVSVQEEADFPFAWLVTGTTFTNDADAQWGVGVEPVETSFSAAWLVRGFAPVDYTASWRILARATFGAERAFHIID